MDIIDVVKYADYEVDESLSMAYREVFNDSDSSQAVLKDMMQQCLWGTFSNHPEIQQEITVSQKVMWRIKAMLNGKPTKMELEDE